MTMNVKTEYVSLPGGFTALQRYSNGGGGIPVLYIHGGPGGNCESFKPMAEQLAESRDVYMYEQLGSDEATHTGEETLWQPERYIEALGVVIAAIKTKKLHLIGRSWGAMLAAEHILRTPDSPVVSITMTSPYMSTALWLADAKARLSEMGEDILRFIEEYESGGSADEIRYKEIVKEYNLRFQCRDYYIKARDANLYKSVKQKTASGMEVYHYMWGDSEFTCTGIMRNIDITSRLPGIKVRVMFVIGEFDQVLPRTCKYYESLIPGSRIAIIPNASQTPFLENPRVFFNTLINFYKEF